MYEQAKWIAYPECDEDGSWLLRKDFETEGVEKAELSVCGLGLGVYYINGHRISDEVLTTPFTRYDKTVIWRKYDVTDRIKKGKNAIGVMLGNGWYQDSCPVWDFDRAIWRDHPKLALFLTLHDSRGKETVILSDSSWKADKGPAIFNHMRSGEWWDARLEQPGWTCPDFDDRGWKQAKLCRGPGGKAAVTKMPPVRVTGTLPCKGIGDGLYDLGQNISGWGKIKVRGKAGDKVVLRYAEHLNEDGTLNERINMFIRTGLKHSDVYIVKGTDTEEYEPSFTYHGFRYIKVESDAEILEIEGRVVHTDLKAVGSFSCGDGMLNKIHQAVLWSTLTNYVWIPTDCPQREQNGWTGDALMSAQQSLMNYDMVSSYRKWMGDFKDAQRPNGQLPGIIPTSGWGYNWGSGPAWDSALIHIPWYVYQMEKDDSLIREMWEYMKRYMDFMISMSEDYLVDYGLGDWCPPGYEETCPSRVTDTAYFYADAVIMAQCAGLLAEDEKEYIDLAGHIKTAYREHFLEEKEWQGSQTFLSYGIYQGLYEKDEIPGIAARLHALVADNDYHINCGILGTKYIFTALSENGYADTAYRMVTNPSMPSYAYWMNSGMTTLCEQWGFVNKEGDYDSLNHHMFSEVDYWFYKYLAGIRLEGEKLVIAPCFLEKVKWVKATHGSISVYWDSTSLSVEVPEPAVIIVNGKKQEVEAGNYRFER